MDSLETEIAQRTPFVGALMLVAWQWLRDEIYEGVHAAGYDDLNPAHIGLIRYPTLHGTRPSEIAARMQITKQSVHDLLGHLEQCGYITREPDPADRRARIVRLTAKGLELEREVRSHAAAAQAHIAHVLGEPRFSQLREALTILATELQAETSPGNGSASAST